MIRTGDTVLWGKPQAEDLAPDAVGLPVEVRRGGSKFLAVLIFLLGGALALGGLAALALSDGGWVGIFPIVLLLAAAGVEVLAVRQWTRFECWRFTPKDVTRSRRGLLGTREWTEPLSAYAGVLSRQEYHGGGEDSQSAMRYTLTLTHRSIKDRSVSLYASKSSVNLRARHRHYARLFGLPALIETPAGVETRRAEDLGKSVRQRVAEGSLKVTFDPSAVPPGGRLTVRVEGEALAVRARLSARGVVGRAVAVGLFIGGGIGYVIQMLPHARVFTVLPALVVLALLLGIVALAAAPWLISEELLLSRKEVRRRWRHPGGTFGESAAPADKVEDVLIQTPPGSRKLTTVQVITDRPVVQFGMWLPLREKEWVRDCIIAVISK